MHHRVSSWTGKQSTLAYGGDSNPKEHGGKRQEAIEPLPLQNPLPLYITGSNEERNEDTCMTDTALVQEL